MQKKRKKSQGLIIWANADKRKIIVRVLLVIIVIVIILLFFAGYVLEPNKTWYKPKI